MEKMKEDRELKNNMLNVEQLTDKEMKLIYDGLMELNYGKYDKEERECIIQMKDELGREAEKVPKLEVKIKELENEIQTLKK